ncbi:hypothetical protein Ari01nite_67730 [Paractinoplanes rishiriensis]|uniref:Uncharacterized protein n=1 Tax=Paractinoplanes rishiriensis TaxID=1050105 RepID=A0A919MXT6_9ACTN|nr:hypothetical protein Ari01nite_67730 [Actinoplanes rishiriensis]
MHGSSVPGRVAGGSRNGRIVAVVIAGGRCGPSRVAGPAVPGGRRIRAPLPPRADAAGAAVRVPVAVPVQLGNSGGTITLLDARGIKADGVAYTGTRDGWTNVF